MKQIKPTVLDIFSGAGGMSLGFQEAGCKILGGIDSNKYAIETHHNNFKSCKLKLPPQDIREITSLESLGLEPGEVDILVGGPPCQVFSRVGLGKMRQELKRNTEKDHRNFLYKEFVRFVAYYKPLCFVMENVDNLANKKSILDKIQHELFANNYRVDFSVLDASRFGVPQRRLRVFIIGVRDDLCQNPIFPRESKNKCLTVGEAISDLPPLEPISMALKRKSSGPRQRDHEIPYHTEPLSKYQETMRRYSPSGVWNHLCRAHNHQDLEIFTMLKQGEKYKDLPKEVMRYRDDIFGDKYKKLIWNEPSWTLTAHMRKDCLAYIHPTQNRSLSVREAARIQSFPDNFIFYAPMTRMFELVGNSVPPSLAAAVAKPLVKIIRQYYS